MKDMSSRNRKWIQHCQSTAAVLARPLKFLPLLVIASALAMILTTMSAAGVEYRILVDNLNRPLPGEPPQGWFYNCMGGDRGLLNDINDTNGTGVAYYSKPTSTSYRGEIQRLIGTDLWEFLGFWESLGRPWSQKNQWNPAAIFNPLIRPEDQGQLVGADVVVNRILSPNGLSTLKLRLELKGVDNSGNEQLRASTNFVGRSFLTNGPFPQVFSLAVNPTNTGNVGLFNVVLDDALPGDSLELDNFYLRVQLPALPPGLEPLLFSLAMLLDNYDATNGMVQDRANFPNGDFENVTATAKLAKLLALGIQANLIDATGGRNAIGRIATNLLTRVPRGPANLWPHFTQSGGTVRVAGTEWSSGDTAYAILDLMTALQLIGDPEGQLPACTNFLRSINWTALYLPGQGYSQGYDTNGLLIQYTWRGFGMETFGVQLAALAGGGPMGVMDPPPTDNGSGFILHANYPMVPSGVDRWGNDWNALRLNEVAQQLAWYSNPAHSNYFIVNNGWFGLSAGECPEGWNADDSLIYQAYGLGGRWSVPNDGNHAVVTPYYSGMVAALATSASSNMWVSLENLGMVSPMNFVESLAMNPQTGNLDLVNWLKGSWNLSLFCEGWLMAQPGISSNLQQAVVSISSLSNAWNQLIPKTPPPSIWTQLIGFTNLSANYVFAAAGSTLVVASTAPNQPQLWAGNIAGGFPTLRELAFDSTHLTSSWGWPRQFTGLASYWSNGVPHFYAGSSGGILEVNPAQGLSDALSSFWLWRWDTSTGLRRDGHGLVWNVGSFGAQSGYHDWNPDEGFPWLAWSDQTQTSNRIYSTSSGALFGWTDLRGYFWHGSNLPPVLLSSTGYSTNAGSSWTGYADTSGNAIQATQGEDYGPSVILIVGQYDGKLYIGGVGRPFRPTDCPVNYPGTIFCDVESGLVVAGSGTNLYGSLLPQISGAGMMTSLKRDGPSIRFAFSGRPGNVHRMEYSNDLVHWTTFSTNTVPVSGVFEVVDSAPTSPYTRFYRSVLLQAAP